jgi:hypothetical protein
MTDPVVSVQGVSFQRDAILKRLETHSTCPVTETTLIASSLLTNTNLQWKIRYWKSKKNDPVEQEEEKEEIARFLCPLTRTIMQDPVMIREGHTYERTALLKFIEKFGEISPNSGKPLGAPCFYASKKLSWEIRHYHWQIATHSPAEAKKEETNETPAEASVLDQEQSTKQHQEPVHTTIKSKTITILSMKQMSQETLLHSGSRISHKIVQDAGILGSDEAQDVLSILDEASSIQMEAY